MSLKAALSVPNDPEEAKALVASLRGSMENKTCFDCSQKAPSWCSVNNSIFLCMDCCGRHRGMGVHLSFMRSAELDDWLPVQAVSMALGGNARARQYFKQHGIQDTKNVYALPVAQQYRRQLELEVKNAMQLGTCSPSAGGAKKIFPSSVENGIHSSPTPPPAIKVESPIGRALLSSPTTQLTEDSNEKVSSPTVVAISSKSGGKKGIKPKKKGLGGVCKTDEGEAKVAKLSEIPQELLFDAKKPQMEQDTNVNDYADEVVYSAPHDPRPSGMNWEEREVDPHTLYAPQQKNKSSYESGITDQVSDVFGYLKESAMDLLNDA